MGTGASSLSGALSRQRRALYQRAYPALLAQIDRLHALLAAHDDNVRLVVLFGSTARLTPGRNSDADLLILVERQARFYQRTPQAPAGVALLVEAEVAAMEQGGWEWPFISLVEEEVSALPAALVEQIARDGVLLYQRQGVPLPACLGLLLPYERWRDQVAALLAGPASSPRRG